MHTRTHRLAAPLALALLVGAGVPALAEVTSQVTLTNKPSYKLYGNGNATASVPFPSAGNAYKLLISGTLHRNTVGTYPREACILIRRLTNLSPQISVVTDEFITQPFTRTTFDANDDATVTDALVLPENLNFNGHFDACSMNEPGHYELTFFEQYDDNAADAGPTPDATWASLTIKFDDAQPALDTPPALTGTVGATTRYGVRSNDTIDHPGQFTGSFIDPLARPANATRIRHVRVSGYVSMIAASVPGELAGPNEASQSRLRLQRYESVQLSPNDPQPFVDTEDLTVALPFTTGSTGYVSLDIPIATGNAWGKLTRNVPQGRVQRLLLRHPVLGHRLRAGRPLLLEHRQHLERAEDRALQRPPAQPRHRPESAQRNPKRNGHHPRRAGHHPRRPAALVPLRAPHRRQQRRRDLPQHRHRVHRAGVRHHDRPLQRQRRRRRHPPCGRRRRRLRNLFTALLRSRRAPAGLRRLAPPRWARRPPWRRRLLPCRRPLRHRPGPQRLRPRQVRRHQPRY